MNELLKNINSLFYSYMSIMVLLLFGVLQSSQEKYENAIAQLHEIQTASVIRGNGSVVSEYIKKIIPQSDLLLKQNLSVSGIGATVEFAYSEVEIDYSELRKKFETQPFQGGDLSRTSIDSLPKEFTNTSRPDTAMLLGSIVTRLSDYIKIHTGTLEDINLSKLSPDFTRARIEAYKYKSTSDNSISVVDTIQYDGIKIIDNINVEKSLSQPKFSCSLELRRAVDSQKYLYLCVISNIAIEDDNYSGARILIPATDSYIVLNRANLMDIFAIDKNRRMPFENAYFDLNDLSNSYADLVFTKIEAILVAEKSRNPNKLSLFGLDINLPLLVKLIFPLLLIIGLYLNLHLNEAKRKVSMLKLRAIDIEVPWIGAYQGNFSKYGVFLQLIGMPIILMALIHYKEKWSLPLTFSWLFFISLLLVNTINYKVILKFRKILFEN